MKGLGHLLVVEDEPRLARELRRFLCRQGAEVRLAQTRAEARKALEATQVDLVILDWMLPDGSGIEFVREIRQHGKSVPVLMLSARSEVEDKVEGLNAGADDYLPKPFSLDELLARLRSLLRRAEQSHSSLIHLPQAGLELNLLTRWAQLGGKVLDLSPKEFELLAYLAARAGEVVSRTALALEVWRADRRFTSLDNVIEVHVANLRRKLREQAGHDLVVTVRGVGYRLKKG